jgi:hypothetical protein
MIKRFTYIVLLLAFIPALSFAMVKENNPFSAKFKLTSTVFHGILADTTAKNAKHQQY